MTQYIDKIRVAESGYDVFTFDEKSNHLYKNVVANVVETMVGRDLDYLLKTKGESLAFPLSVHEIKDLKKYQQ